MKHTIKSLLLLAALVACQEANDSPITQVTEEQLNRCDLIPDPGFCMAYFPKYYYDKTEKSCKQFIWGGCGGIVPFNSLEECRQSFCERSSNN